MSKIKIQGNASGTDGEILTYDASGNPTAVSVGIDGWKATIQLTKDKYPKEVI